MSHHFVDGTLVIARLSRCRMGTAVFKDVTVRSADGTDQKVGTVVVNRDLRPIMVPGTRGRFYVHQLAGSRGVYGYRGPAGQAHASFPLGRERLLGAAAMLNLLVVAFFLLAKVDLAFVAACFAMASMLLLQIHSAGRRTVMAAFAADNRRAATGNLRADPLAART